jgi:hypothetical protein
MKTVMGLTEDIACGGRIVDFLEKADDTMAPWAHCRRVL